MNKKPICFVIMGFGKKADPYTGRTLDLDKTYKNIIRPVVNKLGYECIRADEIQESGIIDKSMYALLMQSELVIADITTYNPNAIYELGVRHAVRPYSTIIIKEKEGKIPFDLDHTRIFKYSHLGDDIGVTEAERCKKELSGLIEKVQKTKNTDSPLYEHITSITPPTLDDAEYREVIKELADREKHIFALVEHAKENMRENNFVEAAELWEKASNRAKNEPYFIQQWALCIYKSKKPSEKTALFDALQVINKLDPEGKTNDPETLGITGAIYKRLWFIDNDIEMLNRAIKFYGKCFKINSDYYTGENYALCLDIMSKNHKDEEEIYYRIQAKKVREEILSILLNEIEEEDFDQRNDKKWVYATLSHCFLAQGKLEEAKKFEESFKNQNPLDWEIETFEESKERINNLTDKE